MGFFDALKRILSHNTHPHATDADRKRIRDAWGLDDDEPTMEPNPEGKSSAPGEASASAYDRAQWEKRLRKILDELPGSRSHWQELMTEAHALKLEPEWIADRQREQFGFLVRKAVSDRVVSEEDHQKLELARKLIGMPEAEAEATLHAIMAEATAFFGMPVKEEP
jgi:hypothetical protein